MTLCIGSRNRAGRVVPREEGLGLGRRARKNLQGLNGFLVLPTLLLAACDAPAPRVDTAGQAARATVDAATKLYSDCVTGHAGSIPVSDEAAGSLALEILKTCKTAREDLAVKVAAFHKLGNPKASQAMSDAVADASVKGIDDELRGQAVVTIVKRQSETKGTKI